MKIMMIFGLAVLALVILYVTWALVELIGVRLRERRMRAQQKNAKAIAQHVDHMLQDIFEQFKGAIRKTINEVISYHESQVSVYVLGQYPDFESPETNTRPAMMVQTVRLERGKHKCVVFRPLATISNAYVVIAGPARIVQCNSGNFCCYADLNDSHGIIALLPDTLTSNTNLSVHIEHEDDVDLQRKML